MMSVAAQPGGSPGYSGRVAGEANTASARATIVLLRDVLAAQCPDRFASLEITPLCALVARFGDGSALYATVAHVGAVAAGAPGKPTWPGVTAEGERTALAGGAVSMRAGYLAGLLRQLLAGAPAVTRVGTYAEAGAVGDSWSPCGLRVDLAGGAAVYLTIVRTSADAGDDPNLPAEFDGVSPQ